MTSSSRGGASAPATDQPRGAPAPSTRRLRIAVLNRVFSPTGGGAERYSMALVEQLAARHEIHVFAQYIDHRWPGVTYHIISSPLKKSRWMNQLWYAAAVRRATRHGFDIVHSHENCWNGNVQTVHVLPTRYKLFHGAGGGRRVLRWLKALTSPRLMTYLRLERARFAPRKNRRIVATSKNLAAQMADAFPASANLLRVLTPGVTIKSGTAKIDARTGTTATPEQRLEARHRLGLPAAGNCLLFIGNDYAKKGLPALIEALAQLDADTWLAVVGNAAHIPEFRAGAAVAGVGDRVHFLGALPGIDDAYVAADCLAHPTLEDTFAMVVLEAMSHGLPVVVSGKTHCGVSGELTHEGNALILDDPRDAPALAAALRRIFYDQPLRTKLCAAAFEFAAARRWPAIAAQQEGIYFEVVDSR